MVSVESTNDNPPPPPPSQITTIFLSHQDLSPYPLLYSIAYTAVTMMLSILAFPVHSPYPFGKNLRLLLANHCFTSAIARAEILALIRDQKFVFPERKSLVFNTEFRS